METLRQMSYTLSFSENILFSYNARIIALIILAIVIFFIIHGKRKRREENVIPRINITEISLIYLMQKMLLTRKQAPGAAMFQLLQAWTNLFPKEGICYFFRYFQPTVLLYKAETVEPVLSSSKSLKKGFEYSLTEVLNRGLLSSDIKQWRYHKKIIAPVFNAQALDDFSPTFNEKAILLNEEITRLMKRNQCIKIDEVLLHFLLNSLCETLLGIKDITSRKSAADYVQAMLSGKDLFFERIYRPWLWPDIIFWRTTFGKQAKRIIKVLENFIDEVVQEKKMEKVAQINNNVQDKKVEFEKSRNKKTPAFIDHLLNIHFQDPNFTLNDIAVEAQTFVGSGFIAVSTTTCWVLYMLGLHPDIQTKVHEELDRVFGEDISSSITKDHIKELNYLNCVIKETMRLYPSAPYISRMLEEDTNINGYIVPKGTTCGILLSTLHRDPKIFPNPEVFDPNRFTTDERIPAYAYAPFGAGPRKCIGLQFAKIEMMIILASLLRHFEVKSMLPLDKLIISLEISIVVKNGLQMVFEPRKPFSPKYSQA